MGGKGGTWNTTCSEGGEIVYVGIGIEIGGSEDGKKEKRKKEREDREGYLIQYHNNSKSPTLDKPPFLSLFLFLLLLQPNPAPLSLIHIPPIIYQEN
jgi:hypothetical protein